MALLEEVKVDPRSRRLLIVYGGTAIASLGLGGAMALILVLIRTPAIAVQNSSLYYQALTAHGLLTFVYWLIFFQAALLIAAALMLRKGQGLWSMRLGWVAFALMLGGLISSIVGVLSGASVLYTAFPPLAKTFSGTPLIYLGFVLLGSGALAIEFDFIATVFSAVERRGSFESWKKLIKEMHIAVFAAMAGMIIAVPGTIISLKLNIPAFLWSMGWTSMSAMDYRMTWALMFHIYHYIPAMVMIGVSYVLVELTTDAQSVYTKTVAKGLFLLYPFFVPPTFLYHLLVDPAISATVKTVGSSLALLVGAPSILHMFIILGMMEARMRSAGHSLFGWLRHLPWRNPAFASMVMGLVTMGLGGLFGYTLLQEQFSPLLHNTFVVPAYIHPMAAGGASLIFMGACYYGVTLLTRRQLWGLAIARRQPYLMALALSVFAIVGSVAGYQGVPRRVPSISYGGDAPASWFAWMNIAEGVGGLLAVVAGALFILVMGMTVVAGKKVTALREIINGMEPPPLEVKEVYKRTPVALLPGVTFVIIGIMLTIFAFSAMGAWPIRFH